MKVGDIIYFAQFERGKGYGNLRKTTVTKVGLKYFDTDENTKIPRNNMVDGHNSDPHKRYFFNEEHHSQFFELIKLKKIIRDFSNSPMNIDIDDMRHIVSLIS